MKSLKIILIFVLSVAVGSCSQEQEVNEQDNQSYIADDFSIDLGKNFFSSEFDLNNVDRDLIINEYVKELVDYELIQSKSGSTQSYVAIDININENIMTITPITGTEPIATNGDDEKCGGRSGDGWKDYGTCGPVNGERCVKEKSTEAAAEKQLSLTAGKCLDIRVKRNTFGARVCARVISC
jgi:hypothetical protein